MLLSWPNPQSKHTEFHYVYSLFQVSVLLKGMLKDCTTELLLSLVANPISCSWPIPSFPEWNSLTGACVCVCPVTQGWPNPLSPVLVSQSVSQSQGPSQAWGSGYLPVETLKSLDILLMNIPPFSGHWDPTEGVSNRGRRRENLGVERTWWERTKDTEREHVWKRRTSDKRPWWRFHAGLWVINMELEILGHLFSVADVSKLSLTLSSFSRAHVATLVIQIWIAFTWPCIT